MRLLETIVQRPRDTIDWDLAEEIFSGYGQSFKGIGLTASSLTVGKIQKLISEHKRGRPNDKLRDLAIELQGRMLDEMSAPRFFSLTDEEASYYNKPTEGWGEVIDRFPAAITDIEEMGKCFALSRYAGAVFHSVQAIEGGLIEFGMFLNVNDPKSGWTAVNKRLDTLVAKTKYPDLDPLYQKSFSFLEQDARDCGRIK